MCVVCCEIEQNGLTSPCKCKSHEYGRDAMSEACRVAKQEGSAVS